MELTFYICREGTRRKDNAILAGTRTFPQDKVFFETLISVGKELLQEQKIDARRIKLYAITEKDHRLPLEDAMIITDGVSLISCRKEIHIEVGDSYIREKTMLGRKLIKPEIVVYYS